MFSFRKFRDEPCSGWFRRDPGNDGNDMRRIALAKAVMMANVSLFFFVFFSACIRLLHSRNLLTPEGGKPAASGPLVSTRKVRDVLVRASQGRRKKRGFDFCVCFGF